MPANFNKVLDSRSGYLHIGAKWLDLGDIKEIREGLGGIIREMKVSDQVDDGALYKTGEHRLSSTSEGKTMVS